MTVARAKGDKAACDDLAKKIVHARGHCQYPRCGSRGPYQCCHIIGRIYAHTRTYLPNLLCLCGTHHNEIDAFIDSKQLVTEHVYGIGHYDELRRRAEQGVRVKFDWAAERQRLKEAFAEVGA